MSQIRKKSLKATTWIYLGFLIGAVNTYFITHQNWFEPNQYGLLTSIRDIGMLLCAFSTLGVTNFLYKFFPYYEDNLEHKKNDLLGLALIVALGGFILTTIAAILIQPLIIRKFSENAILLVENFYWTLPMAFFILLYNILEAYASGFHKGVLTSMLKETVLRLYMMGIIIAKVFGMIDFQTFIILFSCQYAVIVFILAGILYKENKLWIHFTVSRVSIRFRKKIIAIMLFTFLAIVVNVLRGTIDGLILAAKQNLGKVGIFGFSTYLVSILQAPLRSMIAITLPILSRSWKDRNLVEINRIYKRSSINLLSFALLIFFCIWLNFSHAIHFLGINPDYLEGKWVVFLLGIVTIIEMGTGINGQIIATSSHWRFELWTSLLLTLLIIPLSYWLTVTYGIIGPAIANLVSFSVYNYIRFRFLWKKFRLQPFSIKTVEVIVAATAIYFINYYAFNGISGITGILIRSTVFVLMFGGWVYQRDISPDVKPLVLIAKENIRKMLNGTKK